MIWSRRRGHHLGRDFWWYFGGQLASQVGSSFTLFALPLLVFKLTGSATNLALTTASEFVPYLLFGLVLGALVDRLDRKRLMLLTDVARAMVIVLLPVLALTGELRVADIYAVAFVQSVLGILFECGEFAAIPSLVGREDLVAANGRIMATNSAGQIVGPVLAGVLVTLMSPSGLLFVDAASFLVSAGSLAVIRRSFNSAPSPESRTAGLSGLLGDARAGLRFVWSHPVLRSISIMMALINFVSATENSQLVLFAKRALGATDTQVALLFAAGAAGIVIVSLAAAPIRRRLSFAVTALGALVVSGLAATAMALLGSYPAALVLWAASSGFGLLLNINTAALRQAIVPEHMYGRVISVATVLAWSAIPLGALAGAAAIRLSGSVADVYAATGILTALIALSFAFSPVSRGDRYLLLSGQLERVPDLAAGLRRIVMAIVETLSPSPDGRRRLGLASPATGEPVGEVTVSTPDEVTAAIARARAAQPAWAERSAAERAAIIARALDVLLARQDEICSTVMGETGKPMAEALAIEIVPSCDFINHWAGRAAKDLADERVRLHGYMKPLKKLHLHYQPLGVVGVITPWNGPFVLSLNPVVQALLAGNAVVLKPSEVTPHSGGWAAKVLWEAGVPQDVLQLVHGDGETGAALVDGDIDKISFTGSVGTGKKIAASCAGRLIPCSLELGGKDAMIVCADADLERAANGAVYLSMFNSGQVCVGVERIYVTDSVADEFIGLVREKAAALTYGQGSDVGPLFTGPQLDIVRRHVADAKANGASVLVGGEADTDKGLFFQPTVVTGLTHDMDLMSEETFGPVAAIMRVADEDEAVRLANDSRYGLSGSVFTRDAKKAMRIARQLKTGSVVHNDASVIYGVAEAPFGGRKDSGLGQVNGRDAIRSYTHALPVLIDRWGQKKENIWYPYTDKTVTTLQSTIKVLFGNRLVRRFMR